MQERPRTEPRQRQRHRRTRIVRRDCGCGHDRRRGRLHGHAHDARALGDVTSGCPTRSTRRAIALNVRRMCANTECENDRSQRHRDRGERHRSMPHRRVVTLLSRLHSTVVLHSTSTVYI